MTQDEILDALHKVVQENKHYTTWTVSTPHLVALVNLAIEREREACAKVAEKSWQEFQDTKDAHERLSPAPFKLENFGFNHSTIQQSQIIADNIRARGQA
jgi:hypothetical protein